MSHNTGYETELASNRENEKKRSLRGINTVKEVYHKRRTCTNTLVLA